MKRRRVIRTHPRSYDSGEPGKDPLPCPGGKRSAEAERVEPQNSLHMPTPGALEGLHRFVSEQTEELNRSEERSEKLHELIGLVFLEVVGVLRKRCESIRSAQHQHAGGAQDPRRFPKKRGGVAKVLEHLQRADDVEGRVRDAELRQIGTQEGGLFPGRTASECFSHRLPGSVDTEYPSSTLGQPLCAITFPATSIEHEFAGNEGKAGLVGGQVPGNVGVEIVVPLAEAFAGKEAHEL